MVGVHNIVGSEAFEMKPKDRPLVSPNSRPHNVRRARTSRLALAAPFIIIVTSGLFVAVLHLG